MVKYLVQKGYLILNKPCDEDMDCAREAPGTSDSVAATTSAVATSAPTDDSATLATSAVACTASSSPPEEEEETDSSETPSSDEKTRDSSRRSLVQQIHSTGTVREAMQAGGMYDKCPPESKLLVGFKKHLSGALQVQNCQQEVDDVSRFLRYMQPEGEPHLEFMTKTTDHGPHECPKQLGLVCSHYPQLHEEHNQVPAVRERERRVE
ncbi:hypothetical protein CesoFtcFv8_027266 [Champsocephalus esox]|uniref:Uncharacterized protein n=1 Tax=Champsocephalus esox TaxID=159716 RepID=A0AAN8B0S0_9TELE|nr:hypothetical protein CesoFtcFv8_027266 [Champsocephalus esox]